MAAFPLLAALSIAAFGLAPGEIAPAVSPEAFSQADMQALACDGSPCDADALACDPLGDLAIGACAQEPAAVGAAAANNCNVRSDSYECRTCDNLLGLSIQDSCSWVGSYATRQADTQCLSNPPGAGEHCYSFGGHYGGSLYAQNGNVYANMVHANYGCTVTGTNTGVRQCNGNEPAQTHKSTYGTQTDCHYTSAQTIPSGTGLAVATTSSHQRCW
jgi:hypothetical protein